MIYNHREKQRAPFGGFCVNSAVSDSRKIRNVALIGFMGTGKSSVGRLVAEYLRFAFYDTDEWIEAYSGKSIHTIFTEQGEAAFRKLEQQVVLEFATLKGAVISTGGGVGANDANLASLKQHALVVCLWASPSVIWSRVQTQTHRPLLQTENPQEKIRELLAAREPFYRQADILVNTEVRSAKEVAQHVGYEFNFATRSR